MIHAGMLKFNVVLTVSDSDIHFTVYYKMHQTITFLRKKVPHPQFGITTVVWYVTTCYTMRQSSLHIAFKNVVTKCSTLHNVSLLHNLMLEAPQSKWDQHSFSLFHHLKMFTLTFLLLLLFLIQNGLVHINLSGTLTWKWKLHFYSFFLIIYVKRCTTTISFYMSTDRAQRHIRYKGMLQP